LHAEADAALWLKTGPDMSAHPTADQ